MTTNVDEARFRIGVNYWPAAFAMDWLAAYDAAATRDDFARVADAGFDTVRVFLRWEDIQPAPDGIDTLALSRVVDAADAADDSGVDLIVTLFTGHMSGVNWIPAWATGGDSGDSRFRVVSAGRAAPTRLLRSWYADPDVVDAQERLARAVAHALVGHPAVWAWDLGNENSNCSIPPDRTSGEAWLARMSGALRHADPGRPVTVGIHMEDLEEDRRIGPAEAAHWCDFVCMHGYPGYTTWAGGPTDPNLVPFLALVTRWLSGGAPVLFEELGAPTVPPGSEPHGQLVDEHAAASYTGSVIDGVRAQGCTGAVVWCFSDYAQSLFDRPPFDEAPHERSFGLWRADGSAKPAVAAITARSSTPLLPPPPIPTWLDAAGEDFAVDRRGTLARLYRVYRSTLPGG